MKKMLASIATAAVAGTAALLITKYSVGQPPRTVKLIWDNPYSNQVNQVDTAPTPTGPWTRYTIFTNGPSNKSITVSVPATNAAAFFRVAGWAYKGMSYP
jgi:hypothetical protein